MRITLALSLVPPLALALGAGCFDPVGDGDRDGQGDAGRDAATTPAADSGPGYGPLDASAPPDAALARSDASLPRSDAASSPGPDAGDELFCSGDLAKISLAGGLPRPVATTSSVLFLNCCEAADLIFHAQDTFNALPSLSLFSMGGRFPEGEVDLPLTFTPVDLPLTFTPVDLPLTFTPVDLPLTFTPVDNLNASMDIGSTYYGSGPSAAAFRMHGTLTFTREEPSGPLALRVCLTLHAPGDRDDGARFFAPAAVVMGYEEAQRFSLFLLADRHLDSEAAAALPLDSLALDPQPALDLYSIRYYRQGDHFVAFAMGMTTEGLKSRLGPLPLGGLPFVAVADGQPVYRGAFGSEVSSAAPRVPFIQLAEATAEGVSVKPAMVEDSVDPRGDPRILQALEATGKLAP
ncbi:MAG: hypothetical protein HY901_16390 [Deltaproteobacteria bacterium]|nr:hypothetical protein [Deltaproteobacteria bacterium]